MRHFIGIDVGTSAVKTVVADERGRVLASASSEYPLHTPRPLWSEQDPEDWWRAAVESARTALEKAAVQPSSVAGIGLTGQMHGLVLLDASGGPVRPAILWNDQRTSAECEEITRRAGGEEALLRLTGNPALTGFTAPKILWVRRNEPDVFERTARILLPKDFIRFRLTGAFATDVSDASGTLLLDVANRRWSEEMLEICGVDRGMLPDLFEGPEETGRLTPDAASALGLPPGVPVAAGGGDQAAGAVGNGIVQQGSVGAAMGTSGVVFAHSDTFRPDPGGRLHAFCHAVPGKWHLMGVVLSAGGALRWFRDTLASEERSAAASAGKDPYEIISEEAATAPPGCEGLVFLPYLTGERTPHNDPFARGAFVGLTLRHTKAHMARAVMEGAAFAMRDSLELIEAAGVPVEEIRLSGGGARSALWRRIQTDIYGRETATVNSPEGPAFGAALLAGVMAGEWKSVEDACSRCVSVTGTTAPRENDKRLYEAAYRVFKSLYPALKEQMRSLAAFSS